MSKNKLFSFVLAVLVLMTVMPVQAQSRRRNGGRRSSNGQNYSQYNQYGGSGFVGGNSQVAQVTRQNQSMVNRFTQAALANNQGYDPYNAAYGYDTPDRGRHQATQDTVGGWGAANLVGTLGVGALNYFSERSRHNQEMRAIESLRQPQQEQPQAQAPAAQYRPQAYEEVARSYQQNVPVVETTIIVTNRTGVCILINSTRVDNHDTIQVSDINAMRVGKLRGDACVMSAYRTQSASGQRTYDIVCGR